MVRISIVGPMAAGKTQLAKELSKRLDIKHFEIDRMRFPAFDKLGYSLLIEKMILKFYGFERVFEYHKEFEAQLASDVLQNNKDNAIFDFGSGFLAQDKLEYQDKLAKLLEGTLVIGVMPHRELKLSIDALNARILKRVRKDPTLGVILATSPAFDLNMHVINHPFINEIIDITYYQDEISLSNLIEIIHDTF